MEKDAPQNVDVFQRTHCIAIMRMENVLVKLDGSAPHAVFHVSQC